MRAAFLLFSLILKKLFLPVLTGWLTAQRVENFSDCPQKKVTKKNRQTQPWCNQQPSQAIRFVCSMDDQASESGGFFCQPHILAWPSPGLSPITQPGSHWAKQGKLSMLAPIYLSNVHFKERDLLFLPLLVIQACTPWCDLDSGHMNQVFPSPNCGKGVVSSHEREKVWPVALQRSSARPARDINTVLKLTFLSPENISSHQGLWICSHCALDSSCHLCTDLLEVFLGKAWLNFWMRQITQILQDKEQDKGKGYSKRSLCFLWTSNTEEVQGQYISPPSSNMHSIYKRKATKKWLTNRV